MRGLFLLNKKGYFFSLDAFIALIIILTIVLVVKPGTVQTVPQIDLQNDLLVVLSSISVSEIDNAYVQQLILDGDITNFNQSVLEQIGEFYAMSDPKATLMAQSILDELGPEKNIGLYFNGVAIAESSTDPITNADDVWTARQVISGIQAGESATGFSSRAFLSSSNRIDYFYFGGYVGDGNITVQLEDQINSVEIEAVFSGPFDLFVNDQFTETHIPSADVPYKTDLSGHIDKFSSGDNYLDFKSSNDSNLYIAGGFVKTRYNESSQLLSTSKNSLPGIDGLVNFFDSFYVPGNINSMEIFLHYNSAFDIFMAIGNTTVFSGNSGGVEDTVTLTNAQLSSLLDYSDMNQKTVPVRLGIFNASYVFNETIPADVISVTDLSGSMKCDAPGGFCYISPFWCGLCGGSWLLPISNAQIANKAFIDSVLSSSENRVGLVSYAAGYLPDFSHTLSNDDTSLKLEVDNWAANGATCICCGINEAVDQLLTDSNPDKFRSMVVMSDGEANTQCAQQGTGNAKQDAINAACDAFNDNDIQVYSVGFGDATDETTLQAISSCGGGNYYYSDVGELSDIYEQIAQEIIEASYSEQTIIGEGIYTKLFSDSYISIDSDQSLPYGLVISAETSEFGNTISQGNLTVPNDTIPYEINVVSYSGSKWTDKVEVFNLNTSEWETVFELSSYSSDYLTLGDPFVVNIPTEKIVQGENQIIVSTGLGSNSSGGSVFDKIIYTLVKDISSSSTIVSNAEGCIWSVEFEGGTNATVNVPLDYNGTDQCFYNTEGIIYNDNDAIEIAIYNLLTQLDLDLNRMVEVKFSDQDLDLTTSQTQGIPFTWDTEVQARVWR